MWWHVDRVIDVNWIAIVYRWYVNQQAVIAFRLAQPALYSRHHVETYRSSVVDIHDDCVGQQKDWLSFLVLPSGPHNVVDIDPMSNAVKVLDLIAIEGDFSIP